MKKLVSIIMPIFNSEKYLDGCIESIVKQNYRELEIILINDGSIDSSLSICEEYAKADHRIVLVTQENAGVSVARNNGLKIAKGHYVYFADSDDILEPTIIEHLVDSIERNQTDLVACRYKKFSDFYNNEQMIQLPNIMDQIRAIKEIIDPISIAGYLWNKLFKKDIIGDLLFDEQIKICEDEKFCLQYIERIKSISFVDECLYCYRDNPLGAVNQSLNGRKLTYILGKEFTVDYIIKKNIPKEVLMNIGSSLLYICASYYVKLFFVKVDNKQYWKKELLRVFRKYKEIIKFSLPLSISQRIIFLLMNFRTVF